MIRDNNKSALSKLILSELNNLLKEVIQDTKQRNLVKKYLLEMTKAYEKSNIETLNRILLKQTKDQLITLYPMATETLEKLYIDVKRHAELVFSSLYNKFQDYCESKNLFLSGKMPKIVIDYLLEVQLNEKKQTTKIGIVFLNNLDWQKISELIDQELNRIWQREFEPSQFRDNLLGIHSEIVKIKPNPVGWVRLEDVYQLLKQQIQVKNPNWKKGGRLVAYYKDEFSADISKLWKAQATQKIGLPHIELSGIRDPRISYKILLPNGQVGLYGHMRPKREDI